MTRGPYPPNAAMLNERLRQQVKAEQEVTRIPSQDGDVLRIRNRRTGKVYYVLAGSTTSSHESASAPPENLPREGDARDEFRRDHPAIVAGWRKE